MSDRINREDQHETSAPSSCLAAVVAVVAGLSVLAAAMSGVGYRQHWWSLGGAFTILTWATYGALATIVLGIVAVLRGRARDGAREFWMVFVGLTVAMAFASYVLNWRDTARRVPPIHDITTDLDNPPAFVAIVPLRAKARNSYSYGGPDIARQQKLGYPDLGPLFLDMDADAAFDRALAAARAMGWKIVASVPEEGRIEATDTTLWFGFADDVVVRVVAAGGKARIDVRSVSRVGRSDVGTNARRIHAYLARIQRG